MRKSTGSLHATETVDIHDITWLKRFGIHSRRCTTAVASNVGACCLLHRYAASTLFRKFSSHNNAFLKNIEMYRGAFANCCAEGLHTKDQPLAWMPLEVCGHYYSSTESGPWSGRYSPRVSKRKFLHPAQLDEL